MMIKLLTYLVAAIIDGIKAQLIPMGMARACQGVVDHVIQGC